MEEIDWKRSLQVCGQVEALRNRYGHALSAHAFPSLYLWRNVMGLTLYLGEDCFTARCKARGENVWFFPCGGERAVRTFLEHRREKNFSLCYLREQDVEWLDKTFPGEFAAQREPGSDEYLYDREGHRVLKGKLYGNVRAQFNKVLREHRLWTETLTEQNLELACQVLKQWEISHRQPGQTAGLKEVEADREGLLRRKKLGIVGILVYMDGEPYGVEAGYPLSGNTYDLFLSKEKTHVPGFAYYAKRMFFLSLAQQYRYINMEEDLGLEGLRKMKTILAPISKNVIWKAERKKKEAVVSDGK